LLGAATDLIPLAALGALEVFVAAVKAWEPSSPSELTNALGHEAAKKAAPRITAIAIRFDRLAPTAVGRRFLRRPRPVFDFSALALFMAIRR